MEKIILKYKLTNEQPPEWAEIYLNQDLNTSFAPINQEDYGTMGSSGNTTPTPIGETWSKFTKITKDANSANNIDLIVLSGNNIGFQIINAGIYKLSI